MAELEKLRALRARADEFERQLVPDLAEFLHGIDRCTFRRKPDSSSIRDDVNVTTTCSCVMALALTGKFERLYNLPAGDAAKVDEKAQKILERLVRAPWMSSGLTSNNAFTTALVLRTYGFLLHHGLLKTAVKWKKPWDLELSIRNGKGLIGKLGARRSAVSQFVYRSLSDKTRELLREVGRAEGLDKEKERALLGGLTADLRQIAHSGWIYEATRFPRLSGELQRRRRGITTAYERAELNQALLSEAFLGDIEKPKERSFEEIARQMAVKPENFRINNYPPSAAVVYWFVDGVSRASVSLRPRLWRGLCDWAAAEFNHQRSLVLAEHDAMMDPIMMGMAACLCARLRAVCIEENVGLTTEELAGLPSMVELEHSIGEVFRYQMESGIWPKFFPMFHYQEAGSNFCFTFEFLEAFLHEFGGGRSKLLEKGGVLEGLEKAVRWCEENRLEFAIDGRTYRGWNSGGEIEALQKEKPESWATAVVHMFLWELRNSLSAEIQQRILRRYRARESRERRLDDLLDVDLWMEGQRGGLKELLNTAFVPVHRGRTEAELRRDGIAKPRSALLFGPPGTSKTGLAEAMAQALGWPLLVINPSEFVKGGLEKVFVRAEEIFEDLNDLAAVVVLFDEMDALTQSREKGSLDTATQFLTTSMLPQLTNLHDKGRVVFFMATNYQAKFDPAIKRAGRFDVLLCVGPPSLTAKLDNLMVFVDAKKVEPSQLVMAKSAMQEYCGERSWARNQLELYTFADFRGFVAKMGELAEIGDRIVEMGVDGFEQALREHSKYATLRLADLGDDGAVGLPEWSMLEPERQSELLQTEIGRYLQDRLESKRQY